MLVGVFVFLTADTIRPDELARALEHHGYESLFLPEHTHIPASRLTPFPVGGELPRFYGETLDPFLALTAAATASEQLRLGLGVCLVIQRDPIVTAKEVATLDVLSGGRVELGVGAGWNREEIEQHGVEFRSRWKLLRERVEAMQQLWTQDEASYDGELVRFGPSWAWPKPVQRPYPPVLLGSNGPRSVERVLRYADGWIPSPAMGVHELEASVQTLRERALAAGKPRPSVTIFGVDPSDHGRLEELATAGVDRVLIRLPAAPAAKVVEVVARHADLVERYQ